MADENFEDELFADLYGPPLVSSTFLLGVANSVLVATMITMLLPRLRLSRPLQLLRSQMKATAWIILTRPAQLRITITATMME